MKEDSDIMQSSTSSASSSSYENDLLVDIDNQDMRQINKELQAAEDLQDNKLVEE